MYLQVEGSPNINIALRTDIYILIVGMPHKTLPKSYFRQINFNFIQGIKNRQNNRNYESLVYWYLPVSVLASYLLVYWYPTCQCTGILPASVRSHHFPVGVMLSYLLEYWHPNCQSTGILHVGVLAAYLLEYGHLTFRCPGVLVHSLFASPVSKK